MTSDTVIAFLTARRNVDRSACRRWVQAQGISREDAVAVEAAKERWSALPHLLDPTLLQFALEAAGSAKGRLIDGSVPFPSTIWYGGATATYDGVRFKGTLSDFITYVLQARACEIAPKRCGWVVTPTTNIDGHRVNASTTEVHALNLDCDGRGPPHYLIAALDRLGLCFIVYQSGGWSLTTPKWHVLLPLSAPFDTSSPDKIEAWKSAYNSARVIFGALAQLPGEGFDPTVETPSIPIFITERRRIEDPPRQILSRFGHALDLNALMALLPAVEEDDEQAREHRTAAAVVLDDDRLEDITQALCEPMSKILSGRRDLYLSLPGALLDRGLSPDDVRTIVEEVSIRCSGDPTYSQTEVDAKHKEHLHCVETTIGKFERSETYTRIGTLNESWRDVANAIDEILPPLFVGELLAKLEARHARTVARANPTTPASGDAPAAPAVSSTVNLKELRKSLTSMKNKKLRDNDFNQKIRGVILGALLKGEDLVPYIPQPDGSLSALIDAEGAPYDRDRTLAMAMAMVAFKLPTEILSATDPFAAIAEMIRPSVHAMLKEGEGRDVVDSLMLAAKGTFLRSLSKKVDRQDRECAEDLAEVERRQNFKGV